MLPPRVVAVSLAEHEAPGRLRRLLTRRERRERGTRRSIEQLERVDFARGVILLERTKSGRRREVPMNRAVDRVLADLREKQARASDDGVPRGPVFRRTDG